MAGNDNWTPQERDGAPDEALQTARGCLRWGVGLALFAGYTLVMWAVMWACTRPG